jgi:glycyl-tRNA synthetase
MHFHPKLAPIKLAVLPLVNRDGMDTLAQKLEHDLRKHFPTFYDDGGTIGRRYRRQDEAGTPFGATVDSQTLQDDTVTLRDRDTMEQIRVPMKDLAEAVDKKMEGWERRVPGVKGSRVQGE